MQVEQSFLLKSILDKKHNIWRKKSKPIAPFFRMLLEFQEISSFLQFFQDISGIPPGREWDFFSRDPEGYPNILQKVPFSNYQCPGLAIFWPNFPGLMTKL